MTKIRFKSLSSGSCGNCYYLGSFDPDGSCRAGILIDAGVSPRRLGKELARESLGFDDLQAMLITHDHMDHIRSLGSYCKHLGKPVWATERLQAAISRHVVAGEHFGGCRRDLREGWNEVVPGLVSVRYFVVPHDATQTVGFAVLFEGLRYVHITDCGRMTPEALDWCRQADALTLESNYDPDMLRDGPYPPDLQQRIRGGHGHLSNGECAEALRSCLHPGLRHIFLCHLSEHNNTPELAYAQSRAVLDEARSDALLCPLPRQSPSQMFDLAEV